MPLHVGHLAMAPHGDPALELLLVGFEIRRGDAKLGEAELLTELLDLAYQPLELCSAQVRHVNGASKERSV
jgi:hypothetical protein